MDKETLIRDLCSVSFRTKSKTRELVDSYRDGILKLITEEIVIAHLEGSPTKRLTSLYNKLYQ